MSHQTRNSKLLQSFTEYCQAHPQLRFWQALLGWSGLNYGNNILAESGKDAHNEHKGDGGEDEDEGLRCSFRIPHDRPPRWLLVLSAYIDESGQEAKDYVFLAGFLGNDDQWKQFASEWREGLGNKKSLHMASLRWSHPTGYRRTKRLLERLGPIPHRCGLEPVLGGVKVSDYYDLIEGTIDEQLFAGYIAALYPLVIQVLRWIPKHERLELILEAQERYEPFANIALADIVNNQREHSIITDDGKPKLANWRFVPKGSTMLTEPADYFVYALTQVYRDKKSERSQLCMPIMKDGQDSEAIGAIMSRAQTRTIIEMTRTMINWQMVSGIDLKPKTAEEREKFNQLVQRIIAWREDGKQGI